MPVKESSTQPNRMGDIIIMNVDDLRRVVSEIVEQLSSTKTPTEGEPLLISLSVAAQLFSVSEKTIERRIKSGKLKGVKDKGVVRVTRASIDEYIERNGIASEEDDDAS